MPGPTPNTAMVLDMRLFPSVSCRVRGADVPGHQATKILNNAQTLDSVHGRSLSIRFRWCSRLTRPGGANRASLGDPPRCPLQSDRAVMFDRSMTPDRPVMFDAASY